MHPVCLRCSSVKYVQYFAPRVLPAGHLAGLGATRDSYHGLLMHLEPINRHFTLFAEIPIRP